MKNKKAFTIIEVILVIAIAGLIFLMVFIAIPALQRSRRNTQRRQDLSRILSSITDYQTNNNGRMPGWGDNSGTQEKARADLAKLIKNYIVADSDVVTQDVVYGSSHGVTTDKCYTFFCDPDGIPYTITSFAWTGYSGITAAGEKYFVWDPNSENPQFYNNALEHHEIMYTRSSRCDNDNEGRVIQITGQAYISLIYILEGGAIYCGDNQ